MNFTQCVADINENYFKNDQGKNLSLGDILIEVLLTDTQIDNQDDKYNRWLLAKKIKKGETFVTKKELDLLKNVSFKAQTKVMGPVLDILNQYEI